MKQVLVHIRPFDAVANGRVDVRVADGPNGEAFGASGVPWSPALIVPPQLSFEFFSLAMDGRIQAGRAQFTVLADAISSFPRPRDLYWQGAEVKVYLDAALEAAGAVPDFYGLISDPRLDRTTGRLTVTAEVPIIDIDKPLLTKSFTGLGGISGDVGKRGVLLPAGFGANKNIEPIWFDLVRNIGMIDGYGNTVSIDWLGEGLSSFGARVANYASYAALAAAIDSGAIKPGQWGTCVAEGLVGLGAPPAGVITVHATFGANRAGALIRRIAETHCGLLTARIDTAAMASLDTAVNRPVHYWTADQRNTKDLIEAIARSCNATPLMSPQRIFTVTRAVASASVGTIDLSGSTDPRVIRSRRGEPESPYSQIKARTARPGRVLNTNEVNYEDTIVDRGGFDLSEVYRIGNIVGLTDGSEWLYQNPVPSAGNAPPVDAMPDINGYVQDAWWFRRRGPTVGSFRQATPPDNAVEGNEWTDTSNGNLRMRHGGLGLFINGVEITFNGARIDIPWVAVQDQNVLQALDAAAAAAARVAQTEAALIAIGSDGILSRGEKADLKLQVRAITEEYGGIVARAQGFGIVTELATFTASYAALLAYLNGLPSWNDPQFDTPVVAATYETRFADYFAAKTALLTKNDEVAATRAQWSGVSGTGGQPSGADVAGTVKPGGGVATNKVDTGAVIANSFSEFSVTSAANPTFNSGTTPTVLSYTLSKPSEAYLVRVTVTGTMRIFGTSGTPTTNLQVYGRVNNGAAIFARHDVNENVSGTTIFRQFNFTKSYPAASLTNGQAIDIFASLSATGGTYDAQFLYTEVTVEFFKR